MDDAAGAAALQLLLDSLRVYSPTEGEAELSNLLRTRMRSLGLKNVRSDGAGNAIGEAGSAQKKPHLLLCGHIDTIPGMLQVREDGHRVYGRGAVDAKAAMCAMISAAAAFSGEDVHVTVACVTREEGDSLGINTLIEDGGDYDYAIFGEPGGAQRLAVGYRGRVEGRLTVQTPGGHAGSPWAYPSAIDEAMATLAEMRSYAESAREKHPAKGDHYRSLDVTLTMITGGTYSNVIPNSCEARLDIRIPPGTSSKNVCADLQAIVDSRQKNDVKMRLGFEEPTEPYETPANSLLARAFQRSIIKGISMKPILTHKTGTGDMNTMAHRLGVECVTYGPGDSKLEHTDDEFVEVSDYFNSIKVIEGVFGELKRLQPHP